MNIISKNEEGFTVVEALLIVLIIIVVCFAGWYVYHTDHKKTTSTTKTTALTSPYAGWNTYSSLSPVSFKYPSNWTVTTSENEPTSQSVTVISPSRSINGTDYQFDLSLTAYLTSSQYIPTQETVYSSNALTDSAFPKSLYALIMETPLLPGQSPSTCEVMDIYGSDMNYSSGNIGSSIIPTSLAGTDLNIDGDYTKTTNTSGLSFDQTLGCFSPSEFSSFQEVQKAEQIISSLAEN